MRFLCSFIAALFTIIFVQAQEEGSIFREITSEAGFSYSGVSYGHGWADINGDGYPDLFANGHGRPVLYINNGNGSFAEMVIPYYKGYDTINGFPYPKSFFDMHGITWGDVNLDGRPDLYVPIGGDAGSSAGKENILFLNIGDSLQQINSARMFNLQDSLGRGRVGLWFDQNKDGYADMFISNFDRNDGRFSSSLYLYNPSNGQFDYVPDVGLIGTSYYFNTLIRNAANTANLMISSNQLQARLDLYDVSNIPFNRVYTNSLFGIRDIAVGDFNGDGRQDAFISSNIFGSEAAQKNDTTLQAFLYTKAFASGHATENRVVFKAEGKIRVKGTIYPYKGDIRQYWRIGRTGIQPATAEFELDPADTRNHGFFNCFLCVGLHIGYNVNTGNWEIWINDPIDRGRGSFTITAAGPITNVQTVNFSNSELLSPDRLLLARPDGSFQIRDNFLLNDINRTSAVSVAVGDFDNDMDLDLILSCQGAAINYPNRYYQNNGDGFFTLLENFGAAGAVEGRSGTISTADINNDGFLDVFIENGEGVISDSMTAVCFNDGPYQMFLNKGNGNHWVMFDISDRDSPGNKLAYGTTVEVFAKGRRQMRLKGSEVHAFAQNDSRLHFGLAQNRVVDSVIVQWPDGVQTRYYCLKADTIYSINSRNQELAAAGIVPVFDLPEFLCFGLTPPELVQVSLDGVKGTWSPSAIEGKEGNEYVFTPAPGQCAVPFVYETNVADVPIVEILGPFTACAGDTVEFIGVANGKLYWFTGDTSQTVRLAALENTTIILNASNEFGCSASASLQLRVTAPPAQPAVSSNSPVKLGEVIMFSAASIPNAVYQWTGPNGFISDSQNPVIVSADESVAGQYALVISVNGCSSKDTTIVVEVRAGAVISGTVLQPEGRPVSSVELVARGAFSEQTVSESDGSYRLPVFKGETYEVIPQKDIFSNPRLLAALLGVERHLSGSMNLEAPYRIIAADVNNSASLTAADADLLRQQLTGQLQEATEVGKWIFIPTNHVFADEQSPFPFPTSKEYDEADNAESEDYFGFQIGEAIPFSFNGKIISAQLPESFVLKGEEKAFPLQVSGFSSVSAFRWVIEWNPEVAEFVAVENIADGIEAESFLDGAQQGRLFVLWTSGPGEERSLADQNSLIQLVLRAKGDPGQSTAITISEASEATDELLKYFSISRSAGALLINQNTSVRNESKALMAALLPNPAKHYSNLILDIYEGRNCRIEVFDMSGKLLSAQVTEVSAGRNSFEVGHGLPGGMYLIKIQSGDEVLTLKLGVVR